jgi:hypothetical protein
MAVCYGQLAVAGPVPETCLAGPRDTNDTAGLGRTALLCTPTVRPEQLGENRGVDLVVLQPG